MRIFSHTAKSTSVFVVEGTCSFPGEITNRLVQLLELHPAHYYDVFNMVMANNRTAREKLQEQLAPADFRALNGFRLWLNRLDRGAKSAVGTVHNVFNLNTAECLCFVNDNDGSEEEIEEGKETNVNKKLLSWGLTPYDFDLPKSEQ